tara:strand:+ start:19063 stop:19692 length:630 start_codon:yes stop_codon:yes gene_type:complete
MTLKVIGAGFGRTGTLSLKIALEKLGFNPCHHMMEVFGKPDHIALWQDAADGKAVDWSAVFAGYEAAVDWPVCAFWKELSEVYPEAKFILSRRDADKWFASASATIFKGMDRASDDPHMKMIQTLIFENTFGGDIANAEHAKGIFEAHNAEVIATLPAEKLLVFEAADGWQPLCEFLNVEVPSEAYPQTNTTEDFRKRVKSGPVSTKHE